MIQLDLPGMEISWRDVKVWQYQLDMWIPTRERHRGDPRINEDGSITHGVFDTDDMREHFYQGIGEYCCTKQWLEKGLPKNSPDWLREPPWGYYPPLPKKKKKIIQENKKDNFDD